jgi:PleD family two-component response regulator
MDPFEADGKKVALIASIGVASCAQPNGAVGEALGRMADQALFRAKA